jgi:PIN domain nuclease of toxin-antitoxin system
VGRFEMKLLLDTHILFWGLSDRKKLPSSMLNALSAEENELWLSPISVWEILMLAQKERIDLGGMDPQKWVRHILSVLPIKEAPLIHEVAIQSRQIDLPHQDPADRFIMATAIVYELLLMTADQKLIESTYQKNIFGDF